MVPGNGQSVLLTFKINKASVQVYKRRLSRSVSSLFPLTIFQMALCTGCGKKYRYLPSTTELCGRCQDRDAHRNLDWSACRGCGTTFRFMEDGNDCDSCQDRGIDFNFLLLGTLTATKMLLFHMSPIPSRIRPTHATLVNISPQLN